MLNLQGDVFIKDIIGTFIKKRFLSSNAFDALYRAQIETKTLFFDTRILDNALRYKEANVISEVELCDILRAGLEFDEKKIQDILNPIIAKEKILIGKKKSNVTDEVVLNMLQGELYLGGKPEFNTEGELLEHN